MVQCANCGYLTVRHTFERNLVEAESAIRCGGQWPVQRGTNICLYERSPLCFVMARTIGTKDGNYSALEFKAAINEDIECDNFTELRQGFTPKEHREMLDRERLLKWQAEREEEDRQWREEQRKADRRWRIYEGIVFVILAGLFTILGALIASG